MILPVRGTTTATR